MHRPSCPGPLVLLAALACATPDSATLLPAVAYPHAAEPIASARAVYDGTLTPELAITTFRNTDRLFATRRIPRSASPSALPRSARMLESVRFTDEGSAYTLPEYLDLNRVAGLLILRDGQIATEIYRFGNTPETRWMSMSIAKSITSTLIGAALRQGHITSLDDPVTRYIPSLAGSGYDGASVRDILRMVSGVRWDETYTDPASDRRRLLDAQLSQEPGAALAVMRALPRAAAPGAAYTYNTGETQVAAELLARAVGQPLSVYLVDRIWDRMGMEGDAYWWLDSPGGTEIGGSGFSATLRDYGRLGLFLLQDGVVAGDTILPPGWVAEATSPKRLADGTEVDYGYLWWTGTRPASVRDQSYVAEGLYGQFVYVNPAARVVIVVWSARAQPTGSDIVSDWAFFEAVADSLR